MNNVKFDKKFGMVLREHRTKNGLTQQEVCEYLASNIKEGSYEVNTVGRYERGASVVPLTVGLALAELYRTPLAVLIESVDGISDEEMGIHDGILCRQLRKQLNITLEDVGSLLSVTNVILSQIERGITASQDVVDMYLDCLYDLMELKNG